LESTAPAKHVKFDPSSHENWEPVVRFGVCFRSALLFSALRDNLSLLRRPASAHPHRTAQTPDQVNGTSKPPQQATAVVSCCIFTVFLSLPKTPFVV
jgi:hypothetical protein